MAGRPAPRATRRPISAVRRLIHIEALRSDRAVDHFVERARVGDGQIGVEGRIPTKSAEGLAQFAGHGG
jgi:hypothetical protein